MFEEVLDYISNSKKNWEGYSPYRLIPGIDKVKPPNDCIINNLKRLSKDKSTIIFTTEVLKLKHFFIVTPLSWDTKYFGFPIFRIEYIIYDHQLIEALNIAVNQFYVFSCKCPNSYFFIDIPAEDILLVQSLSRTPFRLIETRLNYILKDLNIKHRNTYPVRIAREDDIVWLKAVAIKNANPYDRVHADKSFSKIQADEYLGTFIENAVKGFADFVLVPDMPQTHPFAFLAFNRHIEFINYKISKLVLAASDSSIEKGWLYKLLIEAIRILYEQGTTHLTTITQASNLAAIKSWEKAGFEYGFCTNIFSFTTNNKIS